MFFFVEEMKNEEGRGGNQEGKYIFLWRRRKMRKIFGEGKYIACGGEEKQRRKRRKIFGEDLSKNCQGY